MWFNILPKNKSVRKTILNVVSIYLITTILLILTLSFIYVDSQKDQLLQSQKQQIDYQAKQLINQLEDLHNGISNNNIMYPELDDIQTAIYDIDKNIIFSTFGEKNIEFDKQYFYLDDNVYFIYKVEPYYLGAAYLIIQKHREYKLVNILVKLAISLFFVILFLIFTSFFLVKILIRPLSDNINLLDKFLKDTTHELNTPIAAILGNIEMLNLENMDEKNKKKINRIRIGAITISSIYDDLSFLILNNKIISKNEILNVSDILYTRVEYFKILNDVKNISFNIDIKDNVMLEIDTLKLSRLFDNLISNAIKYSPPSSTIKIKLDNNLFIIEDQGQGMSEDNIKQIFQRYKRFDTTVGGFGIGYNIIHNIIKEYDIDIEIKSEIDVGTKVILTW
mgnify:FL=1